MDIKSERRTILVAPLDWGLGHATRCMVLIRALIEAGHCVILAGSGASLRLLREEFPTLTYAQLPAYDPEYPAKGSMVWEMMKQLPRFIRVIQAEQKVTDELIRKYQVDCVIADNRYGCHSKRVKSIFITHQSNILMPKRFGLLSPLVRWVNEYVMKKFDQCWVPDYPGDHSLAGKLISFGHSFPAARVHYIGSLSRFSKSEKAVEKTQNLLCVFSGPEPQRSIFEALVVEQLKNYSGKVLIVRGLLPGYEQSPLNTHHHVVAYLTSAELQLAIESSEIVLARSGYSTVMDLVQLRARAILVPTPGQTEQEYLACRLKQKGWADMMDQHALNIGLAMQRCIALPGFPEDQDQQWSKSALESAVRAI